MIFQEEVCVVLRLVTLIYWQPCHSQTLQTL
jgi:hypothetical protein